MCPHMGGRDRWPDYTEAGDLGLMATVVARKRCSKARTVSVCPQVFSGAYLATVDLANFMFVLFPVCGSKFKSHSGERVAVCSCLRSSIHSSVARCLLLVTP